MAKAEMTVTVRMSEMASVKLLYLQLEMLAAEMRVAANPAAEALTAILDRWSKRISGAAEGEDDA